MNVNIFSYNKQVIFLFCFCFLILKTASVYNETSFEIYFEKDSALIRSIKQRTKLLNSVLLQK